uniref:ATP synthase epsilon chain, chloroplastic n=1 Tax=Prasinococcus sp. CCMP1194 TaxID=110672 RepID=A0A088CI55_9VIRI|nr:CF1 epsilon subunit of ATP synthase [Prasinococcus sp. CCMP1194]
MNLSLQVMTPNKIVLTREATELILPTTTGQIGILQNHTPLLSALDTGILKVFYQNEWSYLAVFGGFVMIEENDVTVIVNDAFTKEEVDPTLIETEFNEACKALEEAKSQKEKIESSVILKRAKVKLELSKI